MEGLSIVPKGTEKIAELEVNELLGSKCSRFDGCVVFDVKNLEDLVKYSYLTKSSERVILLLAQFKKGDFEENIKKIDLKKWLDKKKFRVSCKQIEDDLNLEDLSGEIGAIIKSKLKAKVDLENPDIVIFSFISGNNMFIGIDLCNFDLNKRQYRIFPHQAALRSTIAYALVRMSGYNQGLTMLDPFCGSGTIPIEAALWALKFPINYFDKAKFAFNKLGDFSKLLEGIDKKIQKNELKIMGYDSFMGCVVGSRKNAKIAGIDKCLTFSRIEISWLDTKFKKGEIDLIVTQPPESSQNKREKDIEKLYNDFFYQAEFILKEKCKIVAITRNNNLLKECAVKYKFKLEEELKVFSGKQEMVISVFIKD